MKTLLKLLLLLCVSVVSAQKFVITNVTVFDGEAVTDTISVLVEDGVITEIAKTITTDATTVDGTGKFLMPALTNCHVHAWSNDALTEAAQAGVTNVLDMHGVEMAQGMMKSLKDSTNYARCFVAGAAATAPGGHGTQYGFPTPTLIKPEEAEGFISDRIAAGADYIKIIVEPWKETLSHETVGALIAAAHAKDKRAVVHISKAEDAKKVLENGADGLVHVWWDTLISTEQLKTWSRNKDCFIMPTLLTSQLVLPMIRKSAPEGKLLSDEQLEQQVKMIYDAGIDILAGTDPPNAGINYGTDLYKELKLLSKAGVPNLVVLKSATSLPAKYFPLGKTGSIKEGYKADMLLLNASPIQDIDNISNIAVVWKDGKKVR
ncbi:amidohydrolase family protein [Rasiella rasia]|uniref:Amidohydrolase family protein n=1 Tax=Rasiella rasia TaxID=2744027 RepID=A0A6G6GI09_9FLAO|nr:amidohydrolase family protein [Rasiella rasia]QIE58140.1 amidohydrolase family protein [Rasiella rasia]